MGRNQPRGPRKAKKPPSAPEANTVFNPPATYVATHSSSALEANTALQTSAASVAPHPSSALEANATLQTSAASVAPHPSSALEANATLQFSTASPAPQMSSAPVVNMTQETSSSSTSSARNTTSLSKKVAVSKLAQLVNTPGKLTTKGYVRPAEIQLVDAPLPQNNVWGLTTMQSTRPVSSSGLSTVSPAPLPVQQDLKSSTNKRTFTPYRGDEDKKAKKQHLFHAEDGEAKQQAKSQKTIERDEAYNNKIVQWHVDPSVHRGQDSPAGIFHVKWNRNVPTIIVTKNSIPKGDKNTFQSPVEDINLFTDYKMKFNVAHSQNLAILFSQENKAGEEIAHSKIVVDKERIAKFVEKDPNGVDINVSFWKDHLASDMVTVENVIKLFSIHRIPGLSIDHAQSIVKFSRNASSTNFGLVFMRFKINRVSSNYWNPNLELSQVMRDQSPWTIVVRQETKFKDVVDNFFYSGWAALDAKNMVYPVWGKEMTYEGKKLIRPWVNMLENGIAPTHHTWMEDPNVPGNYIQHPVVVSFYSRKAFRDILSAGLIFDNLAQQQMLNSCRGKVHNAKVSELRASENIVILDVTLNREKGETELKFGVDTQFILYVEGIFNLPDPNIMIDAGVPAPSPLSYKFHGSIPKESRNTDVKVLINVPDEFLEHFQLNQHKRIALELSANLTPTLRQLTGLENFMRKIKRGDKGYDLQQTILGLPFIGTEKHQVWFNRDKTSIPLLRMVDWFLESVELNPEQLNFLGDVVGKPLPLQMLLGPPGCGKTSTLAITGGLCNILGKHILATAPTNTARDMLFDSWSKVNVKVRQAIGNKFGNPNYKEVNLCLFPTMAETIDSLWTGDIIESSYAEHFLTMMKRDVVNSALTDSEKKAVRLFVNIVYSNAKGENIYQAEKEEFAKLVKTNWTRVFDEANCIFTVVTTCNNSSVLLACKAWTPDWCVVDECAYAVEPDVIIPMTMGATKVATAGDSSQLKPTVIAKKTFEVSEQLAKSQFSRLEMAGHHVHKLNLNYRMHPRLSQFPGMITYEWLGNDITTYKSSDSFLAINEYWYSDAAAYLRSRRRPAQEQRYMKSDPRRILFNTAGSRSAPAPNASSIRNFGNINAIISTILALIAHDGIYKVNPDDITLLSPYKDQKREFEIQMAVRVPIKFGYLSTIDGLQGGQNDVILLDITPAHEFHGSRLGFLKEWNRMNVALTRAKSVIWMFGNFDVWYDELKLIIADNYGKEDTEWSMFLSDLILRGDIVDIYTPQQFSQVNQLPQYDNAGQISKFVEIEHLSLEDEKPLPRATKLADAANQPLNRRRTQESALSKLQDLIEKWEKIDEDFKKKENIYPKLNTLLEQESIAHNNRVLARQAGMVVDNEATESTQPGGDGMEVDSTIQSQDEYSEGEMEDDETVEIPKGSGINGDVF